MEKGDIVIIKNKLVLAKDLRGKHCLILDEWKGALVFDVKVLEGKLKGHTFYLSKNYLQIEQWSVS